MQPFVLVLIHFEVIWNKQPEKIAVQFHRIYAKLGQTRGKRLGVNSAIWERWHVGWRSGGNLELIRNHDAINRFRRMRGPPSSHDRTQAVLIENIPDSFGR